MEKEEVKRIVEEGIANKIHQFLISTIFFILFVANFIGCIFVIPSITSPFIFFINLANAVVFGVLFIFAITVEEADSWNGL